MNKSGLDFGKRATSKRSSKKSIEKVLFQERETVGDL